MALAYDSSSATNLSFGLTASGFSGSLTFTNANGSAATAPVSGQALVINGTAYTLLYTLANPGSTGPDTGAGDIAGIDNAGDGGAYALARDLDGTGTTFATALAGSGLNTFTGAFEGLGHTIKTLTINDTSTGGYDGLFGQSSGTIRDIGLVGGSVSGNGAFFVGGLVGYQNGGTIINAYATGSVSGAGSVGGLVGDQGGGAITNAYATGAVSGLYDAGGLVGEQDEGSITNAYATGAVSGGGWLGGLVGEQVEGSITNAYATGTVSGAGGYVGGLIGNQGGGAISNAYATGAVSGSTDVGGLIGEQSLGTTSNAYATGAVSGSTDVGGLVGQQEGGTIRNAYATGAVSGSSGSTDVAGLVGLEGAGSIITNAYATGAVSGTTNVGGLVGYLGGGSITAAYATGAVSGNSDVGGLVGEAVTVVVVGGPDLTPVSFAPAITDAYATGAVSGKSDVGGLVGVNSGDLLTVTGGWYDTQTTGQASGVGAGSGAGVTGLMTRQLQGLDPISGSTYFSLAELGDSTGAVWGGGANGLYPYLKSFFPNGVQAVSGTAYTDAGVTAAASGANGAMTVNLDAGGSLLAQATTGANGYYYIFVPAGTVASGSNLLVATPANSATGAQNAATLAASTYSAGSPVQSGVNLYGGFLSDVTSATSLSAAPSLAALQSTAASVSGSDGAAAAAASLITSPGYLATGAFTIDQSYSGAGVLVTTPAGGALTVASPVTISSGGGLALLSGGALTIDAPVTAQGAVAVNLTYDGSDPTNLSFGLTGAGFTGSLSFTNADGAAATSSQGGALTINGAAYTLLYSMSDVQGINTNVYASYALATNLDASGTTYNKAPVGGPSSGSFFWGTFEGLGHTISNLTINDTSGAGFDGLFAVTSGTVRDIGLVGGSVSGGDNVGSLVGSQSGGSIMDAFATGAVSGVGVVGGLVGSQAYGSITDAFATGAVSAGWQGDVGGLVGVQYGSITDAYATGSVRARGGGGYDGGLVGEQDGGTIIDAYATGSVSGGGDVGGLAGAQLGGTISNVYATGAVSGSSSVNGLIGNDAGGSITNSYYDSQTTGQSSGGAGALTTAALQGALPAGFSSVWGTGPGLYPYLKTFFPNGVQAVSGTAYQDAGVTVAASGANGAVTVGLSVGGTVAGQATTGANGYYYIIVPAGTMSSGQGLVAYTTADSTTGAANAASYVESATGASGVAASGLNLYGGWLVLQGGTGDATLSGLHSLYASAVGSTAPSSFGLANLEIESTASSFTLDTPISLSGTLSLTSTGAVGQSSGPGAGVSVGALQLSGGGAFTLSDASNQIGTLAGTTGSLSLADGESLTIGSAAGADGTSLSGVASTGSVDISTPGSLTLATGAGVSAGSGDDVSLAATGAFTNQAGASAVTVSGGGRWLIYSSAPGADAFGGLNSNNTAVWDTAAGASVSASGNRYVFAYQPTLTVTTTSASKTYGTDATAQIQSDYTISGYQPGVSGAFLGDDAANANSGAPSLASAGAGASANVAGGPYTISVSLGALTSASGYAFQFVDTGKLTVNPEALTIVANGESKQVGQSDPALTYAITVGSLFNGDSLTGSFSRASGQTPGTYVIGQGSLAASSNYTVTFIPGTFTITPLSAAAAQLPYAPANWLNANLFNGPANNSCVGAGLPSGACSSAANASARSDGGSPTTSGSPVNTPYPANLSGWGDIRFESGSNP